MTRGSNVIGSFCCDVFLQYRIHCVTETSMAPIANPTREFSCGVRRWRRSSVDITLILCNLFENYEMRCVQSQCTLKTLNSIYYRKNKYTCNVTHMAHSREQKRTKKSKLIIIEKERGETVLTTKKGVSVLLCIIYLYLQAASMYVYMYI